MKLFEKYRPRDFGDVIAQDRAIKKIKTAGRNGYGGLAFYLTGASGTGKTTLAQIIAGKVADPFAVTEVDATDLTPHRLAKIEQEWNQYSFGLGGHAYIINEAHQLSKAVTGKLLVVLERIPGHVVVIFTTTNAGKEQFFDGIDAKPLFSRCIEVDLSRQGLCRPFAETAQRIAQAEGLDGQPIEAYEKLAKRTGNNLRAMLQEIDAGAMME